MRRSFDCTVCSGTGSAEGAGRWQGYYRIRKQGEVDHATPVCEFAWTYLEMCLGHVQAATGSKGMSREQAEAQAAAVLERAFDKADFKRMEVRVSTLLHRSYLRIHH